MAEQSGPGARWDRESVGSTPALPLFFPHLHFPSLSPFPSHFTALLLPQSPANKSIPSVLFHLISWVSLLHASLILLRHILQRGLRFQGVSPRRWDAESKTSLPIPHRRSGRQRPPELPSRCESEPGAALPKRVNAKRGDSEISKRPGKGW